MANHLQIHWIGKYWSFLCETRNTWGEINCRETNDTRIFYNSDRVVIDILCVIMPQMAITHSSKFFQMEGIFFLCNFLQESHRWKCYLNTIMSFDLKSKWLLLNVATFLVHNLQLHKTWTISNWDLVAPFQ